MDDIVGRWSTSWFYQDPADEVLVFLPGGRGFFECYWWRLSSYETFIYDYEGENLQIIGDKSFSYDLDQNVVKETSSTLRFSGKFQIREATSDELKLGCNVILQLSVALDDFFPSTNRFGRKGVHGDVSDYEPPTFWELT
ncbi:MAG: hypothetical protein KF770_08080 [Anaerolineae bacterium]|nr:hypothetical protein [Anaerolineae bacterium]